MCDGWPARPFAAMRNDRPAPFGLALFGRWLVTSTAQGSAPESSWGITRSCAKGERADSNESGADGCKLDRLYHCENRVLCLSRYRLATTPLLLAALSGRALGCKSLSVRLDIGNLATIDPRLASSAYCKCTALYSYEKLVVIATATLASWPYAIDPWSI